MVEPDEDIVRRVAELRRLEAREPNNLRRQFYLMSGLMREMTETDQSLWPNDAWDYVHDWLDKHEREDLIVAVFDAEEVNEDEWSRYHSAGEWPGDRPLSHDPIRGDLGHRGRRAAKEDPVQARAF
jgi:hypothetical protein